MNKIMKEELLKAVDELQNEYVADMKMNRYSWEENKNSHAKQFKILANANLKGDKVLDVIVWIHDCYHCYFKQKLEEDCNNPFDYLRFVIKMNCKVEEAKKESLNNQLEDEWLETIDSNLPIVFDDVEDGEWYWIESGIYRGWAMANRYIDIDGSETDEFITIEERLSFDAIKNDDGEIYKERVYE